MALYQHGLAAAIGVFLIVIGVVIPKLIEWQVRDAIRLSLSVDSYSDSGYETWANGKSGDNFRKFIGYEITNPLQFMGGQAPNFQEWSSSDEVWYSWDRQQMDANFSADRTEVSTRTLAYYNLREDSPGSDQKYMLNINWAFVTLVAKTGSENALWSVLANVMLGRMFQQNINGWVGNTSYCLQGSVCGLAQYLAATGTSLTLSPLQLGQIAATLPTASWLGTYATVVPVIYNVNTPAPLRAAYITVANSNFPWFNFTNYASTADPVTFLQYLSTLITSTAQTLTAAYATTPYGLLFKNATLHNHIFGIDPLLALLGQPMGALNNGSVNFNIIKTGYGDDNYLGMDYYVKAQSIFNETRYPGGAFSVAGRQSSVPPFGPRPDTFDIFFPTAMRFVTANFAADANVKGLPVWRYSFDTNKLLAVNPAFGVKVEGAADLSYISSGAPLWASKPRLAAVNASWSSRITGIPAPTVDGESFMNIEGVTGLGVEAAAKLLFNVYINFTQTPFNNVAQNGKEYILPLFQAIDYRVIKDDKAKDLKKAVVTAAKVQTIIRLVLVIVGAVVLGAAVITYGYVLWTDRGVDSESEGLEEKTRTEMEATGEVSNPLDAVGDGAVLPKATASELY